MNVGADTEHPGSSLVSRWLGLGLVGAGSVLYALFVFVLHAPEGYVFSETMHSGARLSRMGVSDVHRVVSCRGGGWKYIRDDEGPTEELYDLEKDPLETRNLADSRPQERSRLCTLVEEHDRLVAFQAAKFKGGAEKLPDHSDDDEIRRRLAALGYL